VTGLARTVRGDLPPGELGVTDAHDHLLLESPVIPGSPLSRRSAAAGAAQDFKAAGGHALVQWTPPGMGRHAEWLPGIAGQAGIHIIAATGVHQARHYSTVAGPRAGPRPSARRSLPHCLPRNSPLACAATTAGRTRLARHARA
jgi:predicted metal-dependent phosphotriesterase family hydrolase